MQNDLSTTTKPDTGKTSVETALSLAQKAGASMAEAVLVKGRDIGVSVREGAVEDVESSETSDLGIRVMFGKRQACVSTSDLSQRSLEKMIERVCAMARIAPEDPYCGLAEAAQLSKPIQELKLFDPVEPALDELIERARAAESSALSVKGINLPATTGASWNTGALLHMTSEGLLRENASTFHSLSAMALAQKSGAMERDWAQTSSRWAEDLKDPGETGLEAANRTIARLGAQKVAGGLMPVLFERRTAKSLLGMLLGAISGSQIARGVSFLKDMKNQAVFSKGVNIVEDPFLLRGAGSCLQDAEGLAKSSRHFVQDGKLTGWAHNLASARQLGEKPSANASTSIGSPPGIRFSNVMLQPGEKTPGQLLEEFGSGLIVTDAFGASYNGGTGAWSVGVAGFAFANGEQGAPVSEMTVAGNLKDIFKILVPASDLILESARETPSLLVPELAVAGQ